MSIKNDRRLLWNFIEESNRIERILRAPSDLEMEEAERFMALDTVSKEDLIKFVAAFQPNAKLRNRPGMNVFIGKHFPTPGGPEVEHKLGDILSRVLDQEHPYTVHQSYEMLHPFMDCNGRSGRILWAWQMKNQGHFAGLSLGFLHQYYYQSLDHARE